MAPRSMMPKRVPAGWTRTVVVAESFDGVISIGFTWVPAASRQRRVMAAVAVMSVVGVVAIGDADALLDQRVEQLVDEERVAARALEEIESLKKRDEQENEYLRAEVAYLKKLDALVRAQKHAAPKKRKP